MKLQNEENGLLEEDTEPRTVEETKFDKLCLFLILFR